MICGTGEGFKKGTDPDEALEPADNELVDEDEVDETVGAMENEPDVANTWLMSLYILVRSVIPKGGGVNNTHVTFTACRVYPSL